MSSWIDYLVPFLLACVLSVLALPMGLKLSAQYGLLDHPGQHKRHKTPTSLAGGSVLYVTFWTTVAVSCLLYPTLWRDLSGVGLYVLAGSTIIYLVGLSDDLQPLSAWVKLLAQVAAGVVLYIGGLKIDPVTVPFLGSYELGSWSILLTIVWVVGLTNAINLIDGLDGLASGVSLIACVTSLVIALLYAVSSEAVFLLAMAGFLVVFLFYNSYPARMFLGDSGALLIGFFFAVISLLVPVKTYTAAALYLPLLALGVPLLEEISSIVRRLLSGRHVMKADRRHLFHYLALAGLSPKKIIAIFYGLSAVFGGFALAMYFWNRLIVFGLLVLFMVVIFGLFAIFMAQFGPGRPLHSRNRRE